MSRKIDLNTMKNIILRHKIHAAVISVFLVAVIAIGAIWAAAADSEEVIYRETTVVLGDLVVGIIESGSVDIGTQDQVFELDMSALQRASTGSSSGSSSGSSGSLGGSSLGGSSFDVSSFGGGGGSTASGISAGGMSGGGFGGSSGGMSAGNSGGSALNMFDQIFSMAGGGSGSGTDSFSDLTVAQVCVSVGQQVEEGDVLYLLDEEAVEELKAQLESDVTKAKADLEAVYADQELSRQTAEYTYESSVAYGSYAQTEYDTTIQSLEEAVVQKAEDLEDAKTILAAYQEQLATAKQDYETALTVQKNSEWSRDNTDKWSETYMYVTYFEQAQSAASNAATLEQKVSTLQRNVEQATTNVNSCARALAEARRSLASGKLTAKQTLDLRNLAYSTAQETYDIATAYLEDASAEQEEIYADAEAKWEEFSSHISGNAILAGYSGVITSVALAEGDTIGTNDTLVTLYDLEEVSMTVSVKEDDMTDIALDGLANIILTAYPDTIFEAAVTEISDASTDSSGNVVYDVTVTIHGDVAGLFQGMTGEVTFITRESAEVLYVSNRAIIREGTRSYVKVKDEKGNIRKKEIVTGFSDGVNVEIVEGLSEGDTVLIESKVTES